MCPIFEAKKKEYPILLWRFPSSSSSLLLLLFLLVLLLLSIYLFIFCQITAPALECYQCSDIPGFPRNSTTCRSGKLGKKTCKGILAPTCYTVKLKKLGLSVKVRDCAIGDVCAPEFQDSRKYITMSLCDGFWQHAFIAFVFLSILISNHHETATKTSKENLFHEQSNNFAHASHRLVQILLSKVHEVMWNQCDVSGRWIHDDEFSSSPGQ